MKSLGQIAQRALRTAEGKSESRTGLIRAVRAACRAQGIEDDDRRALQREVTGKASLGDMTPAEIGRVLDRLNRGRAAPMAHRPHVAKIRALWWSLYWLGAIDDPGERALNAFVKRQTGRNALRFLGAPQAASVIEALKAWCAREGVAWPPVAADADARGERRAVLDALWRKRCDQAGAPRLADARGLGMNVGPLLGDQPDPAKWGAKTLDLAIRHVGKAVRRAAGKSER